MTETIELHRSEISQTLAVRSDRLDLAHVDALRQVLDQLPPIVVRPNPEHPGDGGMHDGGPYQLIDGAHRCAAFHFEGRPVPAIVLELDDTEALAVAARANVAHGRPLTLEDRKSIAARLAGMAPDRSDRWIAQQCGLSNKTVTAIRACSTEEIPQLNTGRDGKVRPAPEVAAQNRAHAEELAGENPAITVRELAAETGVSVGTAASIKAAATEPDDTETDSALIDEDESLAVGEPDAITENLTGAHDRPPTADEFNAAADEAIESRRIPTKPDLGGGVSHPARYSTRLLETFAELLDRWHPTPCRILDPFAGTGRIHELASDIRHTTGVEIEAEWAGMHPDTIVGDALALPFDDGEFNAVVTSPTYGNRLADSHNASDPERRRSYTHDLGRPLSTENSGGLQWGADYRAFHRVAWREAARVLAPDGLLILNIKDHVRNGTRQSVTAWHISALQDLGFGIIDIDALWTGGLDTGTNNTTRRRLPEYVIVLEKVLCPAP